jgi:hypothetical protein
MQTKTGSPRDCEQMVHELKVRVQQATDAEKGIEAQCKIIFLLSAIEVGSRLEKATGYPEDLVAAISRRMRVAGLWMGRLVDDMAWWDGEGSLTEAFSAQVLVARGKCIRECTEEGGARYIDRETGKIVCEWSPRDYMRRRVDPLERVIKRLKSELRGINAKTDAQIRSLIESLDEELLEFEGSEAAVSADVRSGSSVLRMVFYEDNGIPRLVLEEIVSGMVSHRYPLLNAPRQGQIAALRLLPSFIRKGIEILTENYQLFLGTKAELATSFTRRTE